MAKFPEGVFRGCRIISVDGGAIRVQIPGRITPIKVEAGDDCSASGTCIVASNGSRAIAFTGNQGRTNAEIMRKVFHSRPEDIPETIEEVVAGNLKILYRLPDDEESLWIGGHIVEPVKVENFEGFDNFNYAFIENLGDSESVSWLRTYFEEPEDDVMAILSWSNGKVQEFKGNNFSIVDGFGVLYPGAWLVGDIFVGLSIAGWQDYEFINTARPPIGSDTVNFAIDGYIEQYLLTPENDSIGVINWSMSASDARFLDFGSDIILGATAEIFSGGVPISKDARREVVSSFSSEWNPGNTASRATGGQSKNSSICYPMFVGARGESIFYVDIDSYTAAGVNVRFSSMGDVTTFTDTIYYYKSPGEAAIDENGNEVPSEDQEIGFPSQEYLESRAEANKLIDIQYQAYLAYKGGTLVGNTIHIVTEIDRTENVAILHQYAVTKNWEKKEGQLRYHPIPEDAIILDWSYHPGD